MRTIVYYEETPGYWQRTGPVFATETAAKNWIARRVSQSRISATVNYSDHELPKDRIYSWINFPDTINPRINFINEDLPLEEAI